MSKDDEAILTALSEGFAVKYDTLRLSTLERFKDRPKEQMALIKDFYKYRYK
jgi:hypothetical protein